MSAIKEMLSAVMQRAALKPGERQAFEDMWDALHRYGKLSPKQKAWIEKVYFDQKLDNANVRPQAKKTVGFLEDPKFHRAIRLETMEEFENQCPHIEKDGPLWKRVESFLQKGNNVIELRPKKA